MMHTMMMRLCLGALSAMRHVIHSWDILRIGVSIIEMHFVRLVYKNNSTNVDKCMGQPSRERNNHLPTQNCDAPPTFVAKWSKSRDGRRTKRVAASGCHVLQLYMA